MAWTTPMTFIDGAVLTAAQLNTNLRDNFLETVPAKSTHNSGAGGGYFAVNGIYSLAERGIAVQLADVANATSSKVFTDLEHPGPRLSAVTGTKALLFVTATMKNTQAGAMCHVGIDIQGATTRPATDNQVISFSGGWSSPNSPAQVYYFDDLNPGLNVFSMVYAVDGGTGTFYNRRILIMPL